jgi:hypothetical protein
MGDILGHDWSLFAPKQWLLDGKNDSFWSLLSNSTSTTSLPPAFTLATALSWDTLADFEITSNLQDVLSHEALRNYQRPETIGQLYSQLENVVDSFCDLPE